MLGNNDIKKFHNDSLVNQEHNSGPFTNID